MSYQKSVALLSCLFTFSVISLTGAAHPEILPSKTGIESTSTVEFNHPEADISTSLVFNAILVAPPDTTGPTINIITPPADVNLVGCFADFTYSEAAMGCPQYSAYDECGQALSLIHI